MTQSEISDRISLELAPYGTGHSYTWEIYREGSSSSGSDENADAEGTGSKELRRQASEGDTVVVQVFRMRPGYTQDLHLDELVFEIEPLSRAEKRQLKAFRKERKERQDYEQDATYAFERRCIKAMQSGDKTAFSKDLTSAKVQDIVEDVWLWAGLTDMPKGVVDNTIGGYAGKNYSNHGRHGDNAVVVGRSASAKTVLHECAHALLREAGLQTNHTARFRKLALDLYEEFLPGFDLDVIEARAIARDLSIEVDWAFQVKDHLPDETGNGSVGDASPWQKRGSYAL